MNSLGVMEKKQTTLGKLLTYVKQVCFKKINQDIMHSNVRAVTQV